jgi:hypothetical protein
MYSTLDYRLDFAEFAANQHLPKKSKKKDDNI